MSPSKVVFSGKTVQGETIVVEMMKPGVDSCCEFVVSSPKLSYTKWLLYTLLFNFIGYVFNLHLQVMFILKAVSQITPARRHYRILIMCSYVIFDTI